MAKRKPSLYVVASVIGVEDPVIMAATGADKMMDLLAAGSASGCYQAV